MIARRGSLRLHPTGTGPAAASEPSPFAHPNDERDAVILYDITAYGAMIADRQRIGAYRRALEAAVRPGSVVLDLGTGTGIHALIACQLGARRVFAVESADTIQVAREIARDNGFADRIEFMQADVARVTLPMPADVMVSDLRGVLPLFGRHLPTIIDARDRLLRDGAVVVPQRDVLRAAPVEATGLWERIVGPWGADPSLDMTAARRLATQQLHRARIEAEGLLAAPVDWVAIDYQTVRDAGAAAAVEWEVERAGELHGVAVWFDSTLFAGVGLSNAPGGRELIYGLAFFPLPEPVAVDRGDRLATVLAARLVGHDYVWSWDTTITFGDGEARPAVVFRQSTFHGAPLSPLSLERGSRDYVPALSEDGRIDLDALGMIDGSTALHRIAERLVARHPNGFRNPGEALDRVAALVRRYGRS